MNVSSLRHTKSLTKVVPSYEVAGLHITAPMTGPSSSRTTTTSAITLLFLSLLLPSTTSLPISFSDGKNHKITQNYTNTNVFLRNGTTVTLTAHSVISAPASSSDAEEAIRVENAIFVGRDGVIVGGEGVGGAGVTVTTDKERGRVSVATFEEGLQVYGGSAGRESTTRGGNAVQILLVGAEVSVFFSLSGGIGFRRVWCFR
jgi:hypothetical protein